jgi:hypothetical protein
MGVFRATVASLFIFLGACGVGEVPSGGTTDGGGGGDPAATFQAQIAPLVTRCTGCHAGAQGPTLTSYAGLEARYKTKPGSSSLLITKAADGGLHEGITYFSADDKTKVKNWLDSLP